MLRARDVFPLDVWCCVLSYCDNHEKPTYIKVCRCFYEAYKRNRREREIRFEKEFPGFLSKFLSKLKNSQSIKLRYWKLRNSMIWSNVNYREFNQLNQFNYNTIIANCVGRYVLGHNWEDSCRKYTQKYDIFKPNFMNIRAINTIAAHIDKCPPLNILVKSYFLLDKDIVNTIMCRSFLSV